MEVVTILLAIALIFSFAAEIVRFIAKREREKNSVLQG
jgi:hypothetical protein